MTPPEDMLDELREPRIRDRLKPTEKEFLKSIERQVDGYEKLPEYLETQLRLIWQRCKR